MLRERRRRGIPELPAYDTVYRCLQPGRARLDVDLVLDIVRVLGADETDRAAWRSACGAVALGRLALPDDGDAVAVVTLTGRSVADVVGRTAELATLTGDPGHHLVTGMAGVGKTAVATAAAVTLLRTRRVDRALLVSLHGYTDRPAAHPLAITEAVLLALGESAETIATATLDLRGVLLVEALQRQRAVLVLDDAADDAQLAWLPEPGQRAATTWLLVTSRRTLQLPGVAGTTGSWCNRSATVPGCTTSSRCTPPDAASTPTHRRSAGRR